MVEYKKNVLIDKMTDIHLRKHYIEGAGQLSSEYCQEVSGVDIESGKKSYDESYFISMVTSYKFELDSYENGKIYYESFKRLMDIIISLLLFVPITILVCLLSIIIVLDSPGNPIFTQIRVGKNGKFIKVHKLRSMKKDAEKYGQKWAEKNDKRITKFGAFLRKHRLDEIPQIYDVLIGNMSLIGPRPEVPILTNEFDNEIPGFMLRLVVTPGLTGLAQINGGYDLTAEEKLKFDLQYIKKRDTKLYFKVFFKTIDIIFSGEGAR